MEVPVPENDVPERDTNFIPHDERVITIEDSAELQIEGIDNLVSLETAMPMRPETVP